MDLTVFDRTEINQLYEEMLSHLSEAQRERQAAQYGSMEAWKTEYMEKMSAPKAQGSSKSWWNGMETRRQRAEG